MEIKLQNGITVLVDAHMGSMVRSVSWHLSSRGYLQSRINRKCILLHQLVMGERRTGLMIDHINGNRFDNRRCNLRFADKAQNGWNRPHTKRSKTMVKGVCFDRKNSKYIARIIIRGKAIWLGRHETIPQAKAAYESAAKILQGEYAWKG